MLLAIDTSAGQCAAALDTGAAVFMRREHMVKGHAERLFPMIEEVLAEARVAIGAIGKVAVCTGPGSFTGLRIGISAARGLALGLGVEAVGVTRLEALAAETREHWPGHPVAVILALRQGAAVVQVFDTDSAPHGAPEILTLEAIPGAIPPLAIRVGDAGLARSVLAHGLADPGVVARLARHREAVSHPAAPMYLRGADAALPREHPPAILDA